MYSADILLNSVSKVKDFCDIMAHFDCKATLSNEQKIGRASCRERV